MQVFQGRVTTDSKFETTVSKYRFVAPPDTDITSIDMKALCGESDAPRLVVSEMVTIERREVRVDAETLTANFDNPNLNFEGSVTISAHGHIEVDMDITPLRDAYLMHDDCTQDGVHVFIFEKWMHDDDAVKLNPNECGPNFWQWSDNFLPARPSLVGRRTARARHLPILRTKCTMARYLKDRRACDTGALTFRHGVTTPTAENGYSMTAHGQIHSCLHWNF